MTDQDKGLEYAHPPPPAPTGLERLAYLVARMAIGLAGLMCIFVAWGEFSGSVLLYDERPGAPPLRDRLPGIVTWMGVGILLCVPHRWTRGRSWVRLLPTIAASSYEITIEMGSPFPSPLAAPTVTVTGNDGVAHAQTLTASIQPYTFRIAGVRSGAPLLVRIDSPEWSRAGEPADQGIRVDRVSVRPAP